MRKIEDLRCPVDHDEAERDQHNPEVPAPANFDFHNPVNRWRSHRNNFFGQWIRHCYMSISFRNG